MKINLYNIYIKLPYGEWLLHKQYEFICYYINSSKRINNNLIRKSIYNSLQFYPNNKLLLLLLFKYQEPGPLSFV